MATLQATLRGGPETLAARLIEGVLGAVGIVPQPRPSRAGLEEHPSVAIAASLDHAAHYSSVAMSARSTLDLYDGHESWAVGLEDLESEQAHDCAVRLAGIAAGLHLAPGGLAAARAQTSFDELIWCFAAINVVLAFGTEMDPVETGRMREIADEYSDDIDTYWSSLGIAPNVRDDFELLVDAVNDAVEALPDIVGPLAEAIRSTLPSIEQSTASFEEEAALNPVFGLLLGRVLADCGVSLITESTSEGDASSSSADDTRSEPQDQAPSPAPATEPAPAVDDASGVDDSHQVKDASDIEQPKAEPADPLYRVRQQAALSSLLAKRAALAAQRAALAERRGVLSESAPVSSPITVDAPLVGDSPFVQAAHDEHQQSQERLDAAREALTALTQAAPDPIVGIGPGAREAAAVATAKLSVQKAEAAIADLHGRIERAKKHAIQRQESESKIGDLKKRRLEVISKAAGPRKRLRALQRQLTELPMPEEWTPPPPPEGLVELQADAEVKHQQLEAAQVVLRSLQSTGPASPEPAPSSRPTDKSVVSARKRFEAAQAALLLSQQARDAALESRRTRLSAIISDRAEVNQKTATAAERRELLHARVEDLKKPPPQISPPRVPDSLRLSAQAATAAVDAAIAARAVCEAGRPLPPPQAPPAGPDVEAIRARLEQAHAAVSELTGQRLSLMQEQAKRSGDDRTSVQERLQQLSERNDAIRLRLHALSEPIASLQSGESGGLSEARERAKTLASRTQEAKARLAALQGETPKPPAIRTRGAAPDLDRARQRYVEAAASLETTRFEVQQRHDSTQQRLETLRDIAQRRRAALSALPPIQEDSATPKLTAIRARLDAGERRLQRATQKRRAALSPVRHTRRELARARAENSSFEKRISELDERIDALQRQVRRTEADIARLRRSSSPRKPQKRSVAELLAAIKKNDLPEPVSAPPPPPVAPPSFLSAPEPDVTVASTPDTSVLDSETRVITRPPRNAAAAEDRTASLSSEQLRDVHEDALIDEDGIFDQKTAVMTREQMLERRNLLDADNDGDRTIADVPRRERFQPKKK